MSFWLVQNLSEEGFPTGGNDSKGNGDLLDPEAELRGILLIKLFIGTGALFICPLKYEMSDAMEVRNW